MRRSAVGWRWGVVALLVPLALAACEPTPEPSLSPTTTTTTAPATTTTAAPTTTTAAPTTTAPPTTTTTTGGGGGSSSLTLTDTGLTRVRVTLTSDAAWVEVKLLGTHIDLHKVISTSGTFQITSIDTQMIAGSGQGSAVIDFVLSVPPGAATSLAMCKNHRGPASVTVTRRTVGDVVVAQLDNNGTSTEVPPGSCENAASAPMPRAALIGPYRWPARRDPRPLVLAMYYPWFDPDTLAEPFPDQPTGPADTSNPEQVQAAVDLARASNIDGFIVEYEATPAHEAKIDLLWAAADARPGFQLALVLDFDLLAYRNDGLSPAALDRTLNEVASHAGEPSQLEVGGQPVIFLFGSDNVDPAAWSAALARLRDRTGLQPFVIDEAAHHGAAGRYDYGELSSGDQLEAWVQDRLMRLQKEPGLVGQQGPLWVAPVSPGYDDRWLGRQWSTYVPRNGGVRYEQAWDAAVASLPDWILITTWNEYYEQTHVMPGASTGSLALQQTTPRAGAFHRTG